MTPLAVGNGAQRVIAGAERWHVECGDALTVLRSMPSESIDATVTDPPAGIAFMGKEWDGHKGGRVAWVTWLSDILAECFRVAKPGSRLACWSIPRTMHWTGCAVEDAGWQIENTIAHFFGSGFPKGKSQLKPAREDWWIARKPGGKVQPLNIDGCRVDGAPRMTHADGSRTTGRGMWTGVGGGLCAVECEVPAGRWPANLVFTHSDGCKQAGMRRIKGDARGATGGIIVPHDMSGRVFGGGQHKEGDQCPTYGDADGLETVAAWDCVEGCPVRVLDEQSGERTSGGGNRDPNGRIGLRGNEIKSTGYVRDSDTGTASRFFHQFEPDPFIYAAKASRGERNEGCETNGHPTVKSQALMRHLVRLITPPGGTVLDCFAGSGSTGVAAIAEGMRFIGIEREAEYVEIARARIEEAARPPEQIEMFA